MQSTPGFRRAPVRTYSHRPNLPGVLVRAVGLWWPHAFSGTMGTGIREGDERTGGVDDRLLEGAES